MMRAAAVLALAAILLYEGPAGAQVRAEVITGRVTTDSGAVLAGAEVIVTMAPNREIFRDTSDTAGRFRIEIANGTGDYLVYVAAVGRAPFRKRVTRATSDGSATFTVDAALKANVQQLAAVRVQTTPERPPRTTGEFGIETGAAERSVDGVNGAVSPDQAGEIAALAATTPGVLNTGGGISVLGLDPGQSRATLNGMSFGGGGVPRDMHLRTRVYTGTYDPARGGFSGGELALELSPGGTFSSRRARVSLDTRALQAPDPFGRGIDQRFDRLYASLAGDGPVDEGRWHYSYGADVRRSTSDAASLLVSDPAALQVAGVAPDSALRLLTLLESRGIPASVGDAAQRVSDEGTLLVRLDHGRFKPNTMLPADHTLNFTGYARVARSRRAMSSLTMTPATGGEQRAANAMLQGGLSSYFGPGKMWLNDLRTAVTVNSDETTPYLRLPSGQVLVSSLLDDGSSSVASLAFGGSSAVAMHTRGLVWETTDDVQLYPPQQAKHRVKAHLLSRLEYVDQGLAEDPGRFAYNSLADFAAGVPSSFSRTIGDPTRRSGAWNGAIAVGDLYRHSQKFQLLYGVRLEGNILSGRPAYNAALERELGVRNDHVPNRVHASPRLGFTWVLPRATPRWSMATSQLGSVYSGPKGMIRGGIGEFRNAMPATLLGEANANTGLGGVRRLSCVGAAVPVPDWSSYLAGQAAPTACADGAPALADAAPYVMRFDENYDAPRSWRGNLSWSATTLKQKLDYTIDAIYSLNLDQPGIRDLNFAGEQRFTLDGEGRPVFVNPSSIVASTGAVSPAESRRSAAFGRVISRHSSLRSTSRQVTLTLTPHLSFGRYFVRTAYTLAGSRTIASGFDGAAFGDPREREWARSPYDARHQFQLQLGASRRWGTFTSYVTLRSGLPYTPIVRGDVNGDGGSGDRAFVFDPQASGDTGFAAAMQSLLDGADEGARACLTRQLGRAAGRNSCEGPWSTTMNAQFTLGRSLVTKLLRTSRAGVSINFFNPLGGIDQLLHGRDLRGWGSPRLPDPVLYTVRGFDPDSRRFRYEVNQRFGSTSPSHSLARAPFRVTLDVRMTLGRPISEQQLDRWIRPGRRGDPRPKLSLDTLKARYSRNLPDLYRPILSLSDSLLLTPQQVSALDSANAVWMTRLDTIGTELATYMHALPDDYDVSRVLEYQEAMLDKAWEALRLEAQKTLPTILNPVQLRLLPYPAGMLLDVRTPFGPNQRIRYYSG